MRMWIRTVIQNEGLFNDFVLWSEEMENKLTGMMKEAAKKKDFTNVEHFALEIGVYSQMRERFCAERRELLSVADYREKI